MIVARISFILLTLLGTARASQDANFGLGGVTSGRVGSVTAEVENPFAAVYNPAIIPAQAGPTFAFTTAAAKTSYDPFRAVLVDAPQFRTQDGKTRVEDYQLPGINQTLWALGFTYPFDLPKALERRAGVGVVLSGPFGNLRSFSASTPYDFYSLRYGNWDSGFKATAGGSVEVLPKRLYLGGGASFYISSAGSVESTIVTDNPTGRTALDVGLNSAAVAGLFTTFEDTRGGLVYHQQIAAPFVYHFLGKVQIGGADTLNQPLAFHSTLYFEPERLEAELQHDFGPVKGSVGVSYQFWKSFQPPYFLASAPDASGNVHGTEPPALALRNTWNPRASAEVPFLKKQFMLSAGYAYHPTPVEDVSGAANLLDSNAHILGLSLGYRMEGGGWLPPLAWSLFGQYHWLNTRLVTKSSAGFIGAPGYDFSGSAYTYGVSLQAEL